MVLSVNCWSQNVESYRLCHSILSYWGVCVESRRLDLLRRWQHVLFHYTALALTVWKPGAKQTKATAMPGISRSLSLSPSHRHTHTNTHMHAVHASMGDTYTLHTHCSLEKEQKHTHSKHILMLYKTCASLQHFCRWRLRNDAIPPIFTPQVRDHFTSKC